MSAVVVTGLPGSGKTTLAAPLAARLGLPLLSKDTIKELLSDALGTGADPRDLGRVATHLLLGLAATMPSVVLESFFWPGLAEPELLALDRPLVQVHCRCAPGLARARFDARLRDGTRHPVHHAMDDWDRFTGAAGLLDLPGPLVEVDTTAPVDVATVAARVGDALSR